MHLIPEALRARMLANDRNLPNDDDPFPVVKLFTPGAAATWLLTELDSNDQDRAFGLIDTGGALKLGYLSLSEITSINERLGHPIEYDPSFVPQFRLSVYAAAARQTGSIQAAEARLQDASHHSTLPRATFQNK
jgi:hypothetical protein